MYTRDGRRGGVSAYEVVEGDMIILGTFTRVGAESKSEVDEYDRGLVESCVLVLEFVSVLVLVLVFVCVLVYAVIA
jgi:hypothetical protein